MTYDMAGSAVVVGLMKNLALRKAKVNAVGVVGLVENMVSGNAQRPGDIVKSYSGKTIEVLNTDAEGRLVLADALTFTERKFKPKFMVDLATLTGAIIVSLGSEYAGLFSNDDKLSQQLIEAGKKVEEKLWRMPLHKNYDKLINSKNADILIHEIMSVSKKIYDKNKRLRRVASTHTNINQLIKILNIAKPKLTILNHALLFGVKEKFVLSEIKKGYDGNVIFANDLMSIDLGNEINIFNIGKQ